MKIKIKKVYYCEFCGKHSLSIGSINLHEKHCTNNPNRICRLCERKNPIKIDVEITTRRQLDLILRCPICVFSYSRQNKLWKKVGDLQAFNLKKEVKEYWEDQRRKDIESNYY